MASNGTLSTLLLEVTPTAAAGEVAGEPFLKMVSITPVPGRSIDIPLDDVHVKGRVRAEIPAGCTPRFFESDALNPERGQLLTPAIDGSIPVRVSFTPVERSLGLPSVGIAAVTDTPTSTAAPASYGFDVRVPGGSYDVYIEPFPGDPTDTAPVAADCSFPPQLLRDVVLAGEGTSETQLELAIPARSALELEVRWPEDVQTLDGWSVDMIEPHAGRVISNRVRLSRSSKNAGVLVYSLSLAYLPVSGPESELAPASEIVRLTPPAGVMAPTVLLDRTALELFTQGRGVVAELPKLAQPVSVEGRVYEAATGVARLAQLTFKATALANVPAGVLASFTQQVEIKSDRSDGRFKVDLLPGKYHVLAVPTEPGADSVPLAIANADWEIAAEPAQQAGRAIELSRAVLVGGSILSPSGEGARGSTVLATASSWSITTGTWERQLEGLPTTPHAESASIQDSSGEYSFYADPGTFDLSVRTPDGSGLAWLIRPGLRIDAPFPGGFSLPPFRLPLPVPLVARARLLNRDESTARLAQSHVRAYALLDANGIPTNDATQAKYVIPVAESRLDGDASVTLLVPAALDVSSLDASSLDMSSHDISAMDDAR